MLTSTRLSRSGPGLTAIAATLLVAGLVAAQQAPQPAAPTPQQPSEVGARISGEPGAAPHYAVPDFIAITPGAASMAQMLAQVLWDDLNFEREFDMIPRDVYKSIPVARSAEQVPFGAWREIGADGVFFGTVEQKGNDVLVAVRLFNVRTRIQVFGQEYTIAARSARRIAHEVADTVHKDQRGVRGVARTKLAYVSDRVKESLLGTVEKRTAREVYVADYDGANELRITNSRDLNLNPSWSFDARAVAYSAYRRGGAPDIMVSFITTGVLQNITKGRLRDGAYLPAFSPDGKQIAFAATAEGAG